MKILVLCARVPYPLTHGESLRIFNYSRCLSALHELDLVCVGDAERVDPELRAIFRRIDVLPRSLHPQGSGLLKRIIDAFRVESFSLSFAEVTKHLERLLSSDAYDVIWTSSDLARCVPHDVGIPVLVDVCDDGVLLLRRELARTKDIVQRLRLVKRVRVARRFERQYFAGADACLFVAEDDAASFRSLAPGSRTEVIPNGVDADYFAPRAGAPEEATIVFEGSMDFAPNADAAIHLCTDLLPLIHARRRDVKVLLVGRDPTPEVRALASESVTVTGRVDDVRPYLAKGAVFVCPLRMGAGIKNKILQAWSMGMAVVATPVSLGGLDYTEGGNLLVGADSKSFVDAVLKLLADAPLRARLGEAARQTVLNAYRWEVRAEQFEALLKSLIVPYAARAHAAAEGQPASRVLMFALQFPPYALSTGRLRTLGFMRHLPASGWIPTVVTAREQAFPDREVRSNGDVPKGARIIRAPGVDLARTVSLRGLHPGWLATPDRWNTWAIGAAIAGVKAARLHRVDALWATFPVPSALLAGVIAHRLTGLPLIADLRDPIVYETWPESAWDRRVYGWLERHVVHASSAIVLTTPRACAMYRERYPDVPADRFVEISNGVDEMDEQLFRRHERSPDPQGPVTLLHSGLMEIPDRDPTAFFRALQLVKERALLPNRGLRVILRASGRDDQYRAAASAAGVGHLVSCEPRLPHREAIAEFQSATALLLFQGAACNRQIPAKAYEYLASGSPIIGLMDPNGDTHALVHGRWGVPYCADMADPEAISQMLARFLSDLESGAVRAPSPYLVTSYTRSSQARELGRLLERVREQYPKRPGSSSVVRHRAASAE
jgi:glycosyltransferase involved in cell wall biosynthesis